MQKNALVLLSGGLDSCLTLLLAQQEAHVVCALTFDYGQRACHQEINAAQKICHTYGVAHQIITLPFFTLFGQNSSGKKQQQSRLLNQNSALPKLRLQDLDHPQKTRASAQAVWVPNRNGVFLNIAAAYAEAAQIDSIYVGFNREEAQTFPDNSQRYVTLANKALTLSTLSGVQVKSPTIRLHKKAIVQKLITHGFDFNLLWSCYENSKKMCGVCESCLRLKRSLQANDCRQHINSLFIK